MSVTTGITLSEQGITELSKRLAEPEWMLNKRLAAWKAFKDLSLPVWDRTDITGLELDELTIYDAGEGDSSLAQFPDAIRSVAEARSEENVIAIQVDSGKSWIRLSQRLREQGVVVCDFQTALREHDAVLKEHFGTVVPFDQDKLVALHYAAVSSGFLIHVPKNTAVSDPIELRIYSEKPGLALFPHILVVAEQGAEVTIVEGVASRDDQQTRIVSAVVEICPQEAAQIRYAAVQNWGEQTYNFTARRAAISRDARVEWLAGDFGSRLTRSHAHSLMSEDGAESTNLSVFFGVDNQHLDVGIHMQHVGEHTSSDTVTRGVLNDRARVVYRALTDIENGARYTSAFQRENTMLLSEEARSDAIPGLEIDETEVQAGHAATVGQIDHVHLFYLMSRGLTEKDAIHLIVTGFFDPILERMPVDEVKEELRTLIDRKMTG